MTQKVYPLFTVYSVLQRYKFAFTEGPLFRQSNLLLHVEILTISFDPTDWIKFSLEFSEIR